MKIKRAYKYLIICMVILFCLQTVSCNRCDHIWRDANCRNPKTCSLCGVQEGYSSPGGHIWTEANCKDPKTCSICGLTEGMVSSEHAYEGLTCKDCGCIRLTELNFRNYLDFSVSMSQRNTVYLDCVARSVGNPHYKYNNVKIVVKYVSYKSSEDYAKAILAGAEVTYYDEEEITLSLNLAGNGSKQSLLSFGKNPNYSGYLIVSVSGTVQEY